VVQEEQVREEGAPQRKHTPPAGVGVELVGGWGGEGEVGG